jgi:hypothetical protein
MATGQLLTPSNIAIVPISTDKAPIVGSRAVGFTCDFSVNNVWMADLSQQFQQKQIDNVQTVFIDNSSNPQIVTFLCPITGQTITCPPNAQGTFPVISGDPPQFTITSIGSTVKVKFILLNVKLAYQIWNSGQANTYTNLGFLNVAVNGQMTPVSRSVVSVQNVSTQLMPANPNRKYMLIFSPIALWINFIGGAAAVNGADSFPIVAGGIYETGQYCSVDQINYFSSAVAGSEIAAIEG